MGCGRLSDGQTLVAGAHDCKIYIYNYSGQDATDFKMSHVRTFSKHNSVINHIDLSSDGRYMQSNCSAYELLFCDVVTGKQIPAASELKDVDWATWTCTLGWPVQGIWAEGMDGSDINAVDRSHSGHLLATGDDRGLVNLFRYPVVQEKSKSVQYTGHSSHVMNVRWSAGDEYLISCGGGDKCMFHWKHLMSDMGGTSNSSPKGTSALTEDSHTSTSHHDETHSTVKVEEITFEMGEATGGDEAGATKPWVGAIRPPPQPPLIDPSPPNAELKLEWVHGYASTAAVGKQNEKVSNNLFYSVEGDIVYSAAALGIKMGRNLTDGIPYIHGKSSPLSQSYFTGHDDDVLCLCVSENKRFVATGQIASKALKGKATVCIWDVSTSECREVSRMSGCLARGVSSLSFSSDNSQLLAVGLDDSSTHILWVRFNVSKYLNTIKIFMLSMC